MDTFEDWDKLVEGTFAACLHKVLADRLVDLHKRVVDKVAVHQTVVVDIGVVAEVDNRVAVGKAVDP